MISDRYLTAMISRHVESVSDWFVTQSVGAGGIQQDDSTEPSDCVWTDSASSGPEGRWQVVDGGTSISWSPWCNDSDWHSSLLTEPQAQRHVRRPTVACCLLRWYSVLLLLTFVMLNLLYTQWYHLFLLSCRIFYKLRKLFIFFIH